ncbi:MAG: diguanylate cyclase [Syntrophomonas sp.]
MEYITEQEKRHQILVVDDLPQNLKLITEILGLGGYQVRPATSGELALRSLAIELPDLILLDINMPEMNGYELCRRIKEDERSRRVPIIFISALDDVKDKVKGFEIGGVDYITKPFEPAEVLARVASHLSLCQLRQQLEEKNELLQQEIFERRRVERDLREATEKYQTVFEANGSAMAILYPDTGIKMVNEAFCMLSHYSREELEGILQLKSLMDDSDRQRLNEYQLLMQLAPHEIPRNIEFCIIDRFGQTKEILMNLTIIPGTQTSVASIIDISERKRAEEQLKFLSQHDQLTGLYNRTFLTQEIKRLKRKNTLGIIVCDVDGLKTVNDTMGHEAGDELLRVVALLLKDSFRHGDTVARIGGDEFLIVMPESDLAAVMDASQRINRAVADYNRQKPAVPLMLSIGFAVSNEQNTDFTTLFKEADRHMYEEKLRNREEVHIIMENTFKHFKNAAE